VLQENLVKTKLKSAFPLLLQLRKTWKVGKEKDQKLAPSRDFETLRKQNSITVTWRV
jgi:hypothetical protein